MDVLIRDVDSKLIEKLDRVAEKERRSRNQQLILMIEELVSK